MYNQEEITEYEIYHIDDLTCEFCLDHKKKVVVYKKDYSFDIFKNPLFMRETYDAIMGKMARRELSKERVNYLDYFPNRKPPANCNEWIRLNHLARLEDSCWFHIKRDTKPNPRDFLYIFTKETASSGKGNL